MSMCVSIQVAQIVGCIHGAPGGMIREIMLVPFPRAASRDLISFFTFQISTFLSACSVVSLIFVSVVF